MHDNTVKPPVPSSIDVSCVSGVRTYLPPAAGAGVGPAGAGAAAVAPPPPPNTERRELTIPCSQHGGFGLSLLPNGTVVGFGVSCACELPACRYSEAERAGVRLGWRCVEIDGEDIPTNDATTAWAKHETREAAVRLAFLVPCVARPAVDLEIPKTVPLLRQELKRRNLDTGGLKQALLARLYTAIAAEGTHSRSPPVEPQCGASAGCASSVTTADDGGAAPPRRTPPLCPVRPCPSFFRVGDRKLPAVNGLRRGFRFGRGVPAQCGGQSWWRHLC